MKKSLPKLKRPLPLRYNSPEAKARFRAALRKTMRDVFSTPKAK